MPKSKIAPCLWFKDNAEEAVNFYVKALPDARIVHVQRNPVDSPSGKTGSVLIIEFEAAGQKLLALNGGCDFEYTHAISLSVDCETQADVDRVWDALLDGGQAEQCGWLKDRYGVSWQIVPTAVTRLMASPDPAVQKRVMNAVMQMIKLDIAALEAAAKG